MTKEHNYYVYILTNKTHTVLYVGVTNDIERRISEHYLHEDKNSFTAKYNCTKLVHHEHYQWIQDAIEREKEIKAWRREKKESLINDENPEWKDLKSEWE